jgi:hypothetical protein
MTEQHPITPPLELVHQWTSFACEEEDGESWNSIATQAAQWGADQELKACLRYAGDNGLSITRMRAARRLKPPSLKEQALNALQKIEDNDVDATYLDSSIIRRALEALPDNTFLPS